MSTVEVHKKKGGRSMQHFRRLFCCLAVTLVSTALFAQQTGSISGKVTASDKSALPGVTVEARSNVLPQGSTSNRSSPRSSTTSWSRNWDSAWRT